MRTASDLLADYATYHRDERNIITHCVGVPMIVFALGLMLTHPTFPLAGMILSPAWVAYAFAALWFVAHGGLALGLAVSGGVGLLMLLAHQVGAASPSWFAWGMTCFVVGWILQFVGHWYEGRKPAFIDDVAGLLVGPMFVTAEALFALGWNRHLADEIERRAGPRHIRDMASA